MVQYNCKKCPGYCCSYPLIKLQQSDVQRLARHFGLSVEQAARKFTKAAHGAKYALRRKADPHFGKICRFFDTTRRACTVYDARPAVCREYPGAGRCGYYDFLMFERRAQEDDEWVAKTSHG
ncbi:MAG: YkgJ family cysteine cluster protein [Hyphomicrobiaceae bacterium]